jgi:hypothetical protein
MSFTTDKFAKANLSGGKPSSLDAAASSYLFEALGSTLDSLIADSDNGRILYANQPAQEMLMQSLPLFGSMRCWRSAPRTFGAPSRWREPIETRSELPALASRSSTRPAGSQPFDRAVRRRFEASGKTWMRWRKLAHTAACSTLPAQDVRVALIQMSSL